MRILLEEAGGHVYIVEEPAQLLDLKLGCASVGGYALATTYSTADSLREA